MSTPTPKTEDQLHREIRRGENTYHEGFAQGMAATKAEAERLRAENEFLRRNRHDNAELINNLEAEIERLLAALQWLVHEASCSDPSNSLLLGDALDKARAALAKAGGGS